MGVQLMGVPAGDDSAALRKFDKDNNGNLSVHEIRTHMAKFIDDKKNGGNGDGQISKEEATAFLDKLGVKDPQLREQLTHTLTQYNYDIQFGYVGYGHDLDECHLIGKDGKVKETVCINFVEPDEK